MIWPFRRKRKPTPPPSPIDMREWSDDWGIGDLAECLVDGWFPFAPGLPTKGQILRVVNVIDADSEIGGVMTVSAVWLHFEGIVGGFTCQSFRKVRPVQEPASEEFRAFLRDTLKQPETVEHGVWPLGETGK